MAKVNLYWENGDVSIVVDNGSPVSVTGQTQTQLDLQPGNHVIKVTFANGTIVEKTVNVPDVVDASLIPGIIATKQGYIDIMTLSGSLTSLYIGAKKAGVAKITVTGTTGSADVTGDPASAWNPLPVSGFGEARKAEAFDADGNKIDEMDLQVLLSVGATFNLISMSPDKKSVKIQKRGGNSVENNAFFFYEDGTGDFIDFDSNGYAEVVDHTSPVKEVSAKYVADAKYSVWLGDLTVNVPASTQSDPVCKQLINNNFDNPVSARTGDTNTIYAFQLVPKSDFNGTPTVEFTNTSSSVTPTFTVTDSNSNWEIEMHFDQATIDGLIASDNVKGYIKVKDGAETKYLISVDIHMSLPYGIRVKDTYMLPTAPTFKVDDAANVTDAYLYAVNNDGSSSIVAHLASHSGDFIVLEGTNLDLTKRYQLRLVYGNGSVYTGTYYYLVDIYADTTVSAYTHAQNGLTLTRENATSDQTVYLFSCGNGSAVLNKDADATYTFPSGGSSFQIDSIPAHQYAVFLDKTFVGMIKVYA